ncbi:MAG: hypothetical protein AB8H86_06665 [Polyangiales bacterium]
MFTTIFKRLHFSFLFLSAFALGATACNATPLPQPPSIESSQLELRAGDNVTILAASEGAVSDGFAGEVRVTARSGRTTRTVSPDGSFLVSVPGVMVSDIHYVELISAGEERFILAVRDLGAGTALAPPGPDADADGSPDAIDCAPADESLVGQQCMGMCLADDLNCDGLDEDCDGTIDEDCTMCSADAECLASEACVSGMCMPR